MSYLGVVPGAVTPFALINDRGGQVKVAIDQDGPGPRSRELPSARQRHDDGDRARGLS